jgi:hypothetical protein
MRQVLKGVMKRALAIAFGAIAAILAFLLGGAKALTRRADDVKKQSEVAGKAARDKVLAADPRDVLAGLGADTRARIDRAGVEGIAAGLAAALEALHRRGGAGGCQGGG